VEAVVVVPTARERSLAGFLSAWQHELRDATVLVVEDRPERSFSAAGANIRHFAWREIDEQLGEAAWIVPRGSGCVRSFGCWAAHQMRPDMIVALDDDTRPDPAHPDFLATHWARLQSATDPAWVSTLDDASPRGIPYYATSREPFVVLNHGLWNGVPDFDAATQLVASRVEISAAWSDRTIPRGSYFPMCSMNIAWRPQFTPAMYFLLMGRDYPFDRFGDIWGGVLAKRVADHLGFGVNSGSPGILHERASNVFDNLAKESRGLAANETFWRAVDSVVLTQDSVAGAYLELADRLPLDQPEFVSLRRAMRAWAELFSATSVP
jgi:Reversibly glycosylated polypeptide